MRKLIRSKITGHFLTESGEWTASMRDAGEFTTKRAAELALVTLRREDCELYFSFEADGPSRYDFAVPLP